jgi:hypothetical protein
MLGYLKKMKMITESKAKKNGNAKSKTPATDRLLAKGYEIYSVAPGKIERLLPNGVRVRIPSPQR